MFVVPALAGIQANNRLKAGLQTTHLFVVPALAGIQANYRLKAGLQMAHGVCRIQW